MASPTFTRVTFANGSPPAVNATNLNDIESFLDALQTYLSPTGMVGWTAASSAPTGWLLCDGSAISRTTYSGLFAAIGTIHGAGDGSTTFNIPDLREAAVVGVGTRVSGVTAHDTYTLGQFKDDQFQSHNTIITGGGNVTNGVVATPGTAGGGFAVRAQAPSGGETQWSGLPSVDGSNGTPRTGTTTHGKQIGLNGIIKT